MLAVITQISQTKLAWAKTYLEDVGDLLHRVMNK